MVKVPAVKKGKKRIVIRKLIKSMKKGYLMQKFKKEQEENVLAKNLFIMAGGGKESKIFLPSPAEEQEKEKKIKKESGISPDISTISGIVTPKIEKESKGLENIKIMYPLIPLEPKKGEKILAYAYIVFDKKLGEVVYNVIEPKITKTDLDLIEKIKTELEERLDIDFMKLGEVKAKETLRQYILAMLNKYPFSSEKKSILIYYIERDLLGLGKIEPLMKDPNIEDISCDGINVPVFVFHRNPVLGSLRTNIMFESEEELDIFVTKIAQKCGKSISVAEPLLDGTLPDGSRVQATLAKDVTTRGPTFSIRKFRVEPYSPVDIMNLKSAPSILLAYLWLAIETKTSMLICGGVSSGKTTLLNALSMFIQPEEKIVTIEDTRELNLPHENWIPSVARIGFGVGETGKKYGEVTLFELLKESFRQNPDYVIVGEIRGKEAYVMFQGIASGHASISTMHAGSVEDVIKRLETPPIELSPTLLETLDIVVVMTHAKEKGKDARRVKEIVEIESVDPKTGSAHTIKVFEWLPSTDDFRNSLGDSYLIKKVAFERGKSTEEILKELEDRAKFLEWLRENKIANFTDVCKYINLYYKDKKYVMNLVKRKGKPEVMEKKAAKLWRSASGLLVIEG